MANQLIAKLSKERSTAVDLWSVAADLWHPDLVKTLDTRVGIDAFSTNVYGLCDTIFFLEGCVPAQHRSVAGLDCQLYFPPYPAVGTYRWPCTLAGAALRRAFCLRMAERRGWEQLQYVWAHPLVENGTPYIKAASGRAHALCASIKYLMPENIQKSMTAKIAACVMKGGYLWPLTMAAAELRSEFCGAQLDALSYQEDDQGNRI